jgi:hypothetical protein
LDFYIYNVSKETCYLSRPQVFDEIPKTKSVYVRLKIFEDYFSLKPDIPLSLAHLMIQWRNNLLHSAAENGLDSAYSGKLKNATELELENFRHLDCHVMLENFKKGEVPTLKEVGGAVQSINLLAGALDQHVGGLIDWPQYYDRCLRRACLTQRSALKRIWAKPISAARSSSIKMFLATAGIVSRAPSHAFDNYVAGIEALTAEQALNRYVTK